MNNQPITEKVDKLLEAISYADEHGTNQQNLSKLTSAKNLTEKIQQGELDAKQELKGLFVPKTEGSDPDTDISLMEVKLHGGDQSFPLQKYIDDLVQEVEKFQEKSD
jgi:hypothetical protein